MDRDTVNQIRREVDEALTEIAARHSLAYVTKPWRFSSTTLSLKAEMAESEDGVALTSEARTLNANAKWLGLPEDALGRTFVSHGQVFTIAGYNGKARKYPIIANRSDGAPYKFTINQVRDALKREETPQ